MCAKVRLHGSVRGAARKGGSYRDLCIALGIEANSATFSFANALLGRKSIATDPDRLVRL